MKNKIYKRKIFDTSDESVCKHKLRILYDDDCGNNVIEKKENKRKITSRMVYNI